MKSFLFFFVLLNALLLPGCALINSFDKDLDKQIDQWVKQHDYSKALDTISYVRKSHPQYKKLQKRKIKIEKTAQNFEKIKLREINAHIEAKDWQTAEKSLNYSLAKLPDSKKLQTTHREFIKKRAQYLKSLYYQLYINKAEWLVKNKDVQQELSATMPNEKAGQKALQRHKQETEQVYQQLVVCGIEGMNIGDLELAEQCFLLAEELKPSEALRSSISDIQRELFKVEKRETLVLSKKARELLSKAKSTMQSGDLKQSLKIYRKISRVDKKHALVRAFKQELNVRIKDNVTTRVEMGRKLYSQGEIKQALAIWNDIRELDPNNEYLLSHIERAQKVIDKLEQLKDQKTTISPPANKTSTK